MWTFGHEGIAKVGVPAQVVVSLTAAEAQDLVTILRIAMAEGLEHPAAEQFCEQVGELAAGAAAA